MSNNFCHYWRWLLQALLSDNRHSSAINVCSISCWQMTKHSQPLFSTSNNKYRQFIRMLRAFSSLQIKADQILILSHDSLLNRKLKLTVAIRGVEPPTPLAMPLVTTNTSTSFTHDYLNLGDQLSPTHTDLPEFKRSSLFSIKLRVLWN